MPLPWKGTKRLGFLARRRTRSLTFSTRSRSSSSDARFIRRSGGEAVVRRSGPRFVTCLLASLLIPHTPAAALTEVDVALVLAVDISNSMDGALQRGGLCCSVPFAARARRHSERGARSCGCDLYGMGRFGHAAGCRALDNH